MLEKLFEKLNPVKRTKPLTTHGVGFSYSDKEILKNISLNLKKGEILAVIGRSGSGKSTFLKLIAGIISVNYLGKIRVFGLPKFFNREKIGFVPQENSFIPDLSLEDNIKIAGLNLGITERKALEKAESLLKYLKLEESLKKSPAEMSGGQRVRFNIVLSLLHDPDILIMDEPFAGLDFQNRRILWHFIEAMKRKDKSIILTSHLLNETQQHVDKMLILKDRKVFFEGDLDGLRKKMKINFLLELSVSKISKENFEKIRKFCIYKDIKIMEKYDRYIMFGLQSESMRSTLTNLLNKLKIEFKEVGFREPNLDEVFLENEH